MEPRHDESDMHEPSGRLCCPELNPTFTESVAQAIKAGMDEECSVSVLTHLADNSQEIWVRAADAECYTVTVEQLAHRHDHD